MATIDSGKAAGNTDDHVLSVHNTSPEPCVLSEATGIDVELEADTSHPPWTQPKGTLTLQPWESASM